MEWEIEPFRGVGPVRFGMNPIEISDLIGKPLRSRPNGMILRETRSLEMPIVRYTDNKVTEIEFFRDISQLVLNGIHLFTEPGISVMRRLSQMNGGAEETVGIVLFRNLGITTGRLDEGVTGEHSVTAFAKGLWDKDQDFKPIGF